MKKLILLTIVLFSVICFETNARTWHNPYNPVTQELSKDRPAAKKKRVSLLYKDVKPAYIDEYGNYIGGLYWLEADGGVCYTKGVNDAPEITDDTTVYQID